MQLGHASQPVVKIIIHVVEEPPEPKIPFLYRRHLPFNILKDVTQDSHAQFFKILNTCIQLRVL